MSGVCWFVLVVVVVVCVCVLFYACLLVGLFICLFVCCCFCLFVFAFWTSKASLSSKIMLYLKPCVFSILLLY